MSAPKRIRCILEGEDHESWFLTDNGRTFMRWGGDWVTVPLESLTLVGHGLNDPEISKLFPQKQRLAYQPARMR